MMLYLFGMRIDMLKILLNLFLLLLIQCSGNNTISNQIVSVERKNLGILKTISYDKNIDNKYIDIISSFFEEEFMQYSEYSLVDRKEMNRVLSELKLQQTGIINDNSNENIGKFVGADLLLTSTLNRNESIYIVTCRLLDTKYNKVINVSTGKCSTLDKLDGAVKGCSRRITNRIK